MKSVQPRGLAAWWTDDPANPGRASLTNPHVQKLMDEIDPGCRATDLGGTMSLNALIHGAGMVLRVHQPFVSRQRLLAAQKVRLHAARHGLVVPVPMSHNNATVIRCGDRWAELETYIPNRRPSATIASYAWLFGVMGRLHHALSTCRIAVPRPIAATYAPPASLRRWLPVTESAVQHDTQAREIVCRSHKLLRNLATQWVPASRLPVHLVHGDMRLGNICTTPDGVTVCFDFGFLARRPRIHELAYSLVFMILALSGHHDPRQFDLSVVSRLVERYESTAPSQLTVAEKKALPAYIAAVPLYFIGLAGFGVDPIAQLHRHQSLLALSERLLKHPGSLLNS